MIWAIWDELKKVQVDIKKKIEEEEEEEEVVVVARMIKVAILV